MIRRTPKNLTTGVLLADASRQTGLTVWQLRGMARAGKIRSTHAGLYLVLHPEDVQALAASVWQGRAWKPETRGE